MNEIIRNLILQNYQDFKSSFENTKKIFWDEDKNQLIHPGEFGVYREKLAKKWIVPCLSGQFDIGSGFVISSNGYISHQCDLIIYDKFLTPKIENIDNQKFYPIETVVGVGEVKSDIQSISDLNKHLIKLSDLKQIRKTLKKVDPYKRTFQSPYSPETIPFDNIFTFLICNKFNFDFDLKKIDYCNVNQKYKHNVVLSLNDGIACYRTAAGTPNLPFPEKDNQPLFDHFLPFGTKGLPTPIILFLSFVKNACDMTTLLSIDIALYLTDDIIDEVI